MYNILFRVCDVTNKMANVSSNDCNSDKLYVFKFTKYDRGRRR